MPRFVAVHKDRSIIQVSLAVTRVSGLGEDSIFMGVIKVRAAA